MTTSGAKNVVEEGFSVWAPRAQSGVDLILDGRRIPMERGAGGWWQVDAVPEPGTAYGYSLDGGDPRPDPRGRRLPDGPLGLSVVFDPSAFAWTDQDFRGVSLQSAVIYEMHVGTFTPGGTLDSAIDRLDHLVDLGVDLVELLPLASFPGSFGWGYDGVALFAIHEPYGGPEALQRFVDAAHARGLGVCLDAVYNHLGPSGNFLHEFGPYFTDRYHTPWGQALNCDGPDSDEVRRLVLDSVAQWFRDFHLDALRLDAIHEIHDDRALTLLEEMATLADALAHEVGRPLWLIAESDRNDPRTVMTRATSPGGMGGVGLHAQWADDIHHALHVLLTGENESYYADFDGAGVVATMLSRPFLHIGTYSSFRERTHGRPVDRRALAGWRFVAALQTHDQVGNRRVGDRLSATVPQGALACGAALLLTSAYTPMLFMGEEWGAATPWQFFADHPDPALAASVRAGRQAEFAAHGWEDDDVPDPTSAATAERSTLDWSEPAAEPHARLLSWYRALIALRREREDLRDPRLDLVTVTQDDQSRLLVVERGDHRVVANLSDVRARVSLRPLRPSRPDGASAAAEPAPELRILLAFDPAAAYDPSAGVLELPALSACVLGPAGGLEDPTG